MSCFDHLPFIVSLSVFPSTALNDFSETPGPDFFKLHVESSVKGGLKIRITAGCIHIGIGHGVNIIFSSKFQHCIITLYSSLVNF